MKFFAILSAFCLCLNVGYAQTENNPPTIDATKVSSQLDEGGSVDIDLNDIVKDPDGDSLTFTINAQPSNGLVVLSENGQVTYTHNGNQVDADSFSFSASDGNGGSVNVTYQLSINLVNDAPVLTTTPITVLEGSKSTIVLIATDEESDQLEFEISSLPVNGIISINSSKELTYTHDGSESSTDTFSLQVKESQLNGLVGNTVTFNVTVEAINDAPVASDLELQVQEGQSISSTISATDAEATEIRYSISSNPLNGTASFDSNQLLYVHNGSSSLSDEFLFEVSDGTLSNEYKVTVVIDPINDSPVGVSDLYFVNGTSTLTIPASTGVLVNDSDEENDDLTVQLEQGPTLGTLNLNTDGSFDFTANNDGFETDNFTYLIIDSFGNTSEPVTVSIEGSEMQPLADSYLLSENATLSVSATEGLLVNDIEPNGLPLLAELVTSPKYGQLDLASDGSFTYEHDGSEYRADQFSYKIKNTSDTESKPVFVYLTIENVNDAPVANITSIALNENSSLAFYPNYTDLDNSVDQLEFQLYSTIDGVASDLINTDAGVLSINSEGKINYSHNGSENYQDTFYYSVFDGEFNSDITELSIEVTPVNDPPIALGASADLNVDEGATVSGTLLGTDAEGDSLTYELVSKTQNGSIVLDSSGTFLYSNNGEQLSTETFSDVFSYRVSDGLLYSAEESVTIQIQITNDAPQPESNVSFTLNEAASETFNLTNRFTDEEGDSFTLSITTSPLYGAIVLNEDQTYTYSNDGSEVEKDTFTVTATDVNGASSSMVVTLNINPVNDPPLIEVSNSLVVDQLDVLTFPINVSDPEGDATSISYTNPSRGSIILNDDGTYTYKDTTEDTSSDPNEVFEPVSFEVTATDSEGLSSEPYTVSIEVTNVNENLPFVAISSANNLQNITEGGTVTLTASLVSPKFYSQKRDLPSELSANFTYIGTFDGHVYYEYTNPNNNNYISYSEAKSIALQAGAYPVVIESQSEFNYIINSSFWQTSKNQYWLGFNYDFESNAFTWMNGSDLDYTNWNGGNFDASTTNEGYIANRDVWFNAQGWTNTSNGGAGLIVEFDKELIATSDIVFNLTTSGSATSSDDFNALNSQYTIASGSSRIEIPFITVDDTDDEPTEAINLGISKIENATTYNILKSQQQLNLNLIDNEETGVSFEITQGKSIFSENDGLVTIKATLDNAKPFETSLQLKLSGSATKDIDYEIQDFGFVSTLKANLGNNSTGLIQDSSGALYYAENGRAIIKYDPSTESSSMINSNVEQWGNYSPETEPLSQVLFRYIRDMDIDANDNIYLIDENYIRKISLSTSLVSFVAGANQWEASTDGIGAAAKFNNLQSIAVHPDGSKIYVLENNKLRLIEFTVNGAEVTSIAGNGEWGQTDGSGTSVRFQGANSIDVAENGDLYISEWGGIRKYSNGVVSTVLRTNYNISGIDASQNGILYYSTYEHQLFSYNLNTEAIDVLIDSRSNGDTLDGTFATAKVYRPNHLVSTASELYFIEQNNNNLRKADFINKLRIPKNQLSGSYSFLINNDNFYEKDETVQVRIASSESIKYDTTTGIDFSIVSDDNAPEIQISADQVAIQEDGSSAIVTIQLGNAIESGSKTDLDSGLRSEFVALGEFEGSKYYLSNEYRSWSDAEATAKRLGGYLVTINSEAENQFITTQKNNNNVNSIWIGYSDSKNEGQFEWSNSSKSTYSNWQSGEPNNAGDEDYVQLYGSGQWNDIGNSNYRYVIEFSGTKSSEDTTVAFEITGTDGFETDFEIPTLRSVTIPAGSNKASFTISSTLDAISEPAESITIALTEVTTDNGTYTEPTDKVTISIIDNDSPEVSWSATSTRTNEDGSSVIQLVASTPVAKQTDSQLVLAIDSNGLDTAILDVDFEIPELKTVSTFSGNGKSSYIDGSALKASFNKNFKIRSFKENKFLVADTENNVIRLVESDGSVSTYIGNGNWGHDPIQSSSYRTDVSLARPTDIAISNSGVIYIAESGRNRISKVDANGTYSVIAGNGDHQRVDGIGVANTSFRNPHSLALDSKGNLFVAAENVIRKIQLNTGEVTTFAGNGDWNYTDGTGEDARFENPRDLLIDSSDHIYVAENNRIRKVTPNAVVTTYAGQWWDDKDGSLQTARFRNPSALAFDVNKNILVFDEETLKLRIIYTSGAKKGMVETLLGNGSGYKDGSFEIAKFRSSKGIATSASGIYISDSENNVIRRIATTPSITIPAGSTSGSITLKALDDQIFEEALESITVDVVSTNNVSSNSQFSTLNLSVIDNDLQPTLNLTSIDDFVDEEGGVGVIKAYLTDQFSTAQVDMDSAEKSNYYYLGSFEGSTYYASKNNEWLSYEQASAKASQLGGSLAVITSVKENDFITDKIYELDPNYDRNNNRWLNHWIGYSYDSESSQWNWSNGYPSSFENWDGTPYNLLQNKGVMLHEYGKWYNTNKNDTRMYVVEFATGVSDIDTNITVDFSSSTASEADYSSNVVSNTITIPRGSNSALIQITGLSDSIDEAIETVVLSVSQVENATLNEELSTAQIQIKDDELPSLTFSLSKESIGENEEQLELQAAIKNPKLESVVVDLSFASEASNALYDIDFKSPSVNSVSTLAGVGYSGYLDGSNSVAEFGSDIRGIAVDSKGNTYVADSNNNVIRKIDTKGVVSTYAGNRNWNNGTKEGFRTSIDLNWPRALAVDANDQLYIAENHMISRIDSEGNYKVIAGGNDWGSRDGSASEAQFRNINDMVFNQKGDLYVMDEAVLRIVSVSSDASVSTLAGRENDCNSQDGFGTEAQFSCYDQKSIDVDSNGFVYIADGHSNKIRRYDPITQEVKTIAGSYNWGSSDGYGKNASFKNPSGLTIDENDQIYVSDVDGNSIRKIVKDANGYKVSTIAGSDEAGFVNGLASDARFSRPTYMDIQSGSLHIVDVGNITLRTLNTSPKLVIPAGSLSASFTLVSIDDIDYELDETITIQPQTIVGATYSPSLALNATLKSDDQIPIVSLQSTTDVLNENNGTLAVEVKLIDSEGTEVIWENDDLPEANKSSFIFLGTYNGHKYYQSNDQVTFSTAREIAQSLGGDLLVIDDQEENNFIANYIQNGAWIGISDDEQEGVWKPIYGNSSFTNFDQNNNEPNGGTNENYVVTWGQRWYDVNKNNQHSYIVEFGPTKSSGIDTNVTISIAGTASLGEDFTTDELDVLIPAGSNKVKFNITGIDDDLDEPIENIVLTISGVGENQAIISSEQDNLNIRISDDEQPTLTFNTSTEVIAENGGEAVVSVELSNEKVNPTIVNFNFGGDATIIDDYSSLNLFEVSTFSGEGSGRGYIDGVSSSAKFQDVLRIEAYDDNSFVFVDRSNKVIRKLNSDGSVETLIGNGDWGDQDGLAREIGINNPQGLDVDAQGNIYFVTENNKVRKYDKSTNRVITLAGSGEWGYLDGVGSNATFRNPKDIAVGANGELYVADENNTIRVISVNEQGNYEVSSLVDALTNNNEIYEGDLSQASVGSPNALEFDTQNNKLYVISNGYYLVEIDFNTNQLKKYKLTKWDDWGAIQDLTLGTDGSIYFTNQNNHTLNKFELKPLPSGYGDLTSWKFVTDYNGTSFNFFQDSENSNLIKTIVSVDQDTWTQIWEGNVNEGTQYGSWNNDQYLDQNEGGWIGFEYFTKGTYEVTINLTNQSYAISNVSTELSSQGYALTQIAGSGDNGYVDAVGLDAQFYYPMALEASNNFVLVFDYNNFVFRKVNVVPSIEVPAGTKEASLTLKAHKDQYFEGEEVVQLEAANILNGVASNATLDSFKIIDATGLRLVEGAPFEGVENGKVSWGDYDRDGDMDLALMGQGNDGTITNIYKNTNGQFTNTNQNFTKFIGGDIEFVDVDQDGWLDVAVSGNSPQGRKSELYINRGAQSPSAPYFELMTNYQVEGLSQSDMEWGDLDNDGDADLIIAGINDQNEYRTLYYTNLGNYEFLQEPLFQSEGLINPQLSIVDIDADGDNDLFVNGTTLSKNLNSNRFTNTYFDTNSNFYSQVFQNGKVAYLDIDSNGSFDYYAMGEDENSKLKQASNLNISLLSLRNPDFDFADYNNDGLNDVILTGEDENGTPTTKLYTTVLKNGSEYRLYDTGIEIIGLREGTVDWIDYDFDGDLDLFMTGLGNDGTPKSVLYEAFNYENSNTPPSKITNLTYEHDGNGLVTFKWDKPEDNVSKEFRYAVRIGTSSGGSDVRYANSNLENGNTLINIPSLSTLNELQVILDPGTYYVAVQAIDGGNRGGQFSDELTLDINYDWKRLNLGGVIDRRLRPSESSQLKFVDIDGDSDMDLVSNQVGMNNVGAESLNIYKFENEVFVPVQSYGGGNTTFGLGDLNNDGAIDIVYAQEESNGVRLQFAINNSVEIQSTTSTPTVDQELFSNHYLMNGDQLIPSLFNPQIVIKDLNNDGLVEVILAGSSSQIESEAVASIYVLNMSLQAESLGYNNFNFTPQKLIESNATLNQLSFISFDMGDVDNDKDYDLVITGYGFSGYSTILFENTGNLEGELFVETSNNFLSVKDGTASFVDVDGDGKLDVLFSGQSSEGDVFKAYKNTGNINNFAALDLGLPAIRNSKVDFGDFNGDGYYDILYSGVIQGEGEVTKLATFNATSNRFETSTFDVSKYLNASVGFGDFDGDNDLDFVLTGKDANSEFISYITDVFINVRSQENANKLTSKGSQITAKNGLLAPDEITVQRKRISDNLFEVTVSWNQGQNRAGNPDSALTYSLKVGTEAGAEDILASGADSNGVRKTATRGNAENNLQWKLNLKPGDYNVAVQSVDASFIGSAFSDSKGFSVVNSYKLGDSNGDDVVNVLDLTTNIDYILGKNPAIFINEVADVNFDEVINVTDISGIVDIILNTDASASKGEAPSKETPLNYYSNESVGTVRLVSDGYSVRMDSDQPITALEFAVDADVNMILSDKLSEFQTVSYTKNGLTTYMIYSMTNKNILDATTELFRINSASPMPLQVLNMAGATERVGTLTFEFEDEYYLNTLAGIDDLMLYPNPAMNEVNLLLGVSKFSSGLTINVYNLSGAKVISTERFETSSKQSLNVGSLPTGIYIVEAVYYNEQGVRVVKKSKLLKNRK